MRIGKKDLIREILSGERDGKLNTTRGASEAVDAVFEGIKQLLKNRGKVNIPGFGTFVVTESKPRVARNPRTGETVKVPARKRVKLRMSLKMKDSL